MVMAQSDNAPKLEIPKRWSEATAGPILDAQEKSGKSLIRFSKEHGIDPMRVYRWKRRLRATSAVSTKPCFVPVKICSSPKSTEASGGLELVLANGRVIRIQGDFDAEVLRRVVSALEEGSPC
jgi:hypothetical protein